MDTEATLKILKETLQREVESLRQTREELQLQANLACADLKTEWDRLETRFRLAQEEVGRLSGHTQAASHEFEQRVRSLISEIKAGYERIRHGA